MNLDNLKLVTPEEHRKYYKNYRFLFFFMTTHKLPPISSNVSNYLKFYIKDKYIYCENVITKECVIVGTLDNITIGIDLGQDSDKMFEALATIDAGSISRTKNGMYF